MTDAANSIAELFTTLYNQFVLRDILGYVLPGAIILFALLRQFPQYATLFQNTLSVIGLSKKYFIPISFLALSFITGNAITGLVNDIHSNPVYSYVPKCPETVDTTKIYSKIDSYEVFRVKFEMAKKKLDNESLERVDDRYNLYFHITMNVSAAFFILALFLIAEKVIPKKIVGSQLVLILTCIIIGLGLYLRFYRIREHKYDLEKEIIKQASNIPCKNDSVLFIIPSIRKYCKDPCK